MPSVLDIKRAVRERDGGCVGCGISNADHRARFGRMPDVHRRVPGSVYSVEGCVTLCRTCHGPQPKRRRGQPDLAVPTPFRTAPVSRDLARMVRAVCVRKRMKSMDYLDSVLRPIVAKAMADLAKRIQGKD